MHVHVVPQLELLLEYDWSRDAWGDSLRAAVDKRHVAAVTALLGRHSFIDHFSLTFGLADVARSGDMEMLRLLGSHLTDTTSRQQCLLMAVLNACGKGQVRITCHGIQAHSTYVMRVAWVLMQAA